MRESEASSRAIVHLVAADLLPFASAAVARLQEKYLNVQFELADGRIIAAGGGFLEETPSSDIEDELYREKILSDGAPLRKILFDWLF